MIKDALILLAMTVVAAAATHFFHPQAPIWFESEIPRAADEVTVEDVKRRWGSQVLWVDARINEDYAKSHIPGALLINEQHRDQQLIEHFERLQDNKLPIIIYCDGHACQASRKMRTYFMENITPGQEVWVLKGGWSAWESAHRDH